ncbi:MAG: response regulator transcription factor [Chitinophagales bacterium]|nr:response regulator transcription factor [Chitinophagales bacterium]
MNTIIIADDHKIFAESLANMLQEQNRFQVITITHSIAATKVALLEYNADLLLLDYHFPDGKGIDVAGFVHEEQLPVKTIMLSMENDFPVMQQAEQLGVNAYLIKNLSSAELIEAMEQVLAGEKVFMWPEQRAEQPAEVQLLSPREQEIVQLVRQGLTSQEIAAQLFLSNYTVETHRRNILRKLNMKNTAMLVQWAEKFL